MMPEDVTGPLDHLYLRHQGLLVVQVLQADGLRVADRRGTSDPFVEVAAQASAVHKTRVVPKTLEPVWNETKYVLVQVRRQGVEGNAGGQRAWCRARRHPCPLPGSLPPRSPRRSTCTWRCLTTTRSTSRS